MKITITTIIICIGILACNGQVPDAYSIPTCNDIKQNAIDSVNELRDSEILVIETNYQGRIDSLNNLITQIQSESFINPESFNLQLEANGVNVIAKRDTNQIWLSIIVDTSRYHLWYLPDSNEIISRVAYGTKQRETWDIKNKSFYYNNED